MSIPIHGKALVLLCLVVPLAAAQAPSQAPGKPDTSKEALVIEQSSDQFKFEDDGTWTREQSMRVRVQSDAGVQQLGLLKFSYQSASESFVIDYVRVRSSDGAVVASPEDNFQDMPADVTREAPFYSDIHEKHVAVKGLEPGKTLEFQVRWQHHKATIPNQFWLDYNFAHEGIVLSEDVQVSVPKNRAIKLKSPVLKPSIREEGQYRIYAWHNSNLEHKDEKKHKRELGEKQQEIVRGRQPQPDFRLSSFQSWDEVGRWYGNLQRDRIKPYGEIQAKADELTKGATDETAKIRALYNFVSTHYRYIGIAFGIGRFQPHAAEEVFENQYGDCKDKHTLLASLLSAVGIKAYPALISSTREVDEEVPSPAQFDHAITVIPQGTGYVWIDSTTEVAPFGYLLSPLRNKHALVIRDDKPSVMAMTPADPPYRTIQEFRMKAKLDDNGTLESKADFTVRDDQEVVLRAVFRRVAFPEWKNVVQQISYALGFGGDVSDVNVSSPEKTDEPFHISYTYKRKKYGDWDNRRISPPFPQLSLPDLGETDEEAPSQVWLGPPGEVRFTAELELPKGSALEMPPAAEINTDFAEYSATYAVKNNVLSAQRHLLLKARELRPKDYEEFRKFRKSVSEDYTRMLALSMGPQGGVSSFRQAIQNLTAGSNPQAMKAFAEAQQEMREGRIPQARESLEQATKSDPAFVRAWLMLADLYKLSGQIDKALEAFRKATEAEPPEPVSYKAYAYALMSMQEFEDAVPVWQKFIKIKPDDQDGPANLASCLNKLERYEEEIGVLKSAVQANPDWAGLQVQLGSAYLKTGKEDEALKAYKKALEANPNAGALNDAAYELAEAGKGLPIALEYAEKAVGDVEEESNKIQLSEMKAQDYTISDKLAAYWDTLGWVHFRVGNLEKAEKYLRAAWLLGQDAVIGEHLGQVCQKLGKNREAERAYWLALKVLTDQSDPELRKRIESAMDSLEAKGVTPPSKKDPGAVLSEERTKKIPQIHKWGGGYKSAEFLVALTKKPGAENAKFLGGAQELKAAASALSTLSAEFPFPGDSEVRIVRHGILNCSEVTGGCLFVFTPANLHPPTLPIPLTLIPKDRQ